MPALPSLLLALALAAPASAAGAGAGPAGGPTLATEDTLHAEVPPVLVSAPRVTLDEILDRVARGEQRRDSLMRDQSFLATVRLVRNDTKSGRPEVVTETVARIWKKKPGLSRVQVLRHFEAHPRDKTRTQVKFDVTAGMDEEIVNFAFRPEARRAYRYRIVSRELVGGHLIYRIAFQPRSLLDPGEPRGEVWVDTNDFVIVRQEVGFARSPAPPLLKDVKRVVIERRNAGGYWVLARVLMRAEASIPLPQVGRSFDFAMRFDDYAINAGLPDSLFAARPARRKP